MLKQTKRMREPSFVGSHAVHCMVVTGLLCRETGVTVAEESGAATS